MANNDTVPSSRNGTNTGSAVNTLDFMTQSAIIKTINTALPVRVDAVYPGKTGPVGRVDVTPLVCQLDAANKALPRAASFNVPYLRVQGGIAALIIDPEPGDIGIAIFAQQDISRVVTGTGNAVQPGSYRRFDLADAMYIGGIVNKQPEIYLELTQDKVATLHAPMKVVVKTKDYSVECETWTVNATKTATITAETIRLNGSLHSNSTGGTTFNAGNFAINADHVSLNEGCE